MFQISISLSFVHLHSTVIERRDKPRLRYMLATRINLKILKNKQAEKEGHDKGFIYDMLCYLC